MTFSLLDAVIPKDCYFETHFGVVCTDDTVEQLRQIAKESDCHLSRNVFKRHDEETYTIMMTYRQYTGTYEKFSATVDAIKEKLTAEFDVEKVIAEFSVYDTKVSHDTAWLLA